MSWKLIVYGPQGFWIHDFETREGACQAREFIVDQYDEQRIAHRSAVIEDADLPPEGDD